MPEVRRPRERARLYIDVGALDGLLRSTNAALQMAFDAQLVDWRAAIDARLGEIAHYGQLPRLTLPAGSAFTDAVAALLTDAALQSSEQMVREAARVKLTLTPLSEAAARQSAGHRARALGSVLGEHVATTAKARVLNVTQDQVNERVVAQTSRYLDGLAWRWPRDQVAAAGTAAVHLGRVGALASSSGQVLKAAEFYFEESSYEIRTTYVASEILDNATCDECETVDGRVYETLEDALGDYPSTGYVWCLGGARCRGTLYVEYEEIEETTRAWWVGE